MKLNRHDIVVATFAPQRRDDLKDGGADFIGWRGEWQVCWEIEEGDYAGQWALAPFPLWANEFTPPFGWVPECDLADIELVGGV